MIIAPAVQTVLTPDAAGYPEGLRRCLGEEAPGSVRVLGNTGVLGRDLLALFCSVRCPGNLILRTYDLAQVLRVQGVAAIGGFHSPMEQECLRILLRGPQPVVVCPARSIQGMRVPAAWRGPLEAGRLLVVSPFEEKEKRVTAELASRRNLFVAALAERVFISYAEEGGKMMALAGEALGWGKPVLTFEGEENRALIELGATPARVADPGSAHPVAVGGCVEGMGCQGRAKVHGDLQDLAAGDTYTADADGRGQGPAPLSGGGATTTLPFRR